MALCNVFCLLYYSLNVQGDETKKSEMNETCAMHGEDEKCIQNVSRET
jgi:hypothetical protein